MLHGMAICAGGGGLEIALKLALGDSYKCVLYIEREVFAASTLVKHMEEGRLDKAPLWDDLKSFRGDVVSPFVGNIDILSGGIPCQPHSIAGLQRGEDDERDLWPDTARIIADIQPGRVFLENVPGIITPNGTGVCVHCWSDRRGGMDWDSTVQKLLRDSGGRGNGRKGETIVGRDGDEVWRQGDEVPQPNGQVGDSLPMAYLRGYGGNSSSGDSPLSFAEATASRYRAGTPTTIGDSSTQHQMDPGVEEASGQLEESDSSIESERAACSNCGRCLDGIERRQSYYFERIGPDLRAMGYSVETGLFSASEVGASHQRQRFFILGHRDGGSRDLLRRGVRQQSGRGIQDVADADEFSGRRSAERRNGHLHSVERESPQKGQVGADREHRATQGSHVLADADATRPQGRDIGGHGGGERAARPSSPPLFAPFRNSSDEWSRLLSSMPEAEPAFCGASHGSANGFFLNEDRVDRLRSLGNMVVPLTGALAFTHLTHQAGLHDGCQR